MVSPSFLTKFLFFKIATASIISPLVGRLEPKMSIVKNGVSNGFIFSFVPIGIVINFVILLLLFKTAYGTPLRRMEQMFFEVGLFASRELEVSLAIFTLNLNCF